MSCGSNTARSRTQGFRAARGHELTEAELHALAADIRKLPTPARSGNPPAGAFRGIRRPSGLFRKSVRRSVRCGALYGTASARTAEAVQKLNISAQVPASQKQGRSLIMVGLWTG